MAPSAVAGAASGKEQTELGFKAYFRWVAMMIPSAWNRLSAPGISVMSQSTIRLRNSP